MSIETINAHISLWKIKFLKCSLKKNTRKHNTIATSWVFHFLCKQTAECKQKSKQSADLQTEYSNLSCGIYVYYVLFLDKACITYSIKLSEKWEAENWKNRSR